MVRASFNNEGSFFLFISKPDNSWDYSISLKKARKKI